MYPRRQVSLAVQVEGLGGSSWQGWRCESSLNEDEENPEKEIEDEHVENLVVL